MAGGTTVGREGLEGKTLNLPRYRVNLEGVDVGTRVLVRGKGSDAGIEPVGDAGGVNPQE